MLQLKKSHVNSLVKMS